MTKIIEKTKSKKYLSIILILCTMITMISLVENTLVSYGAGLVAGETTTLINQGSITNDCGIPRLDEIIFEVGIQRDKDTYVEMENGKNKVLDKFEKKFISNGGNSLFFTSRDMYSLMESRYNGKFVLGWYNPSNKSLKCIGDNSYLARIKVMETSPVNPTASASFPSGGKYYNGLKTTYTLDTISELANGAWKNYINNDTYGGMQVWSWILQKTGSGTWDIKNRLEQLTNPTGLDLNKVSEWTPEQQYEHKLRILDLLLMYYEIFPNEHQGKAEVASAIDDWITGRNLTETPVTFVITTSVAVNPGEPTNQATGHIITRTIDYLNYVSGAELAYMVNGPFYDAIVPAATAPAGGNNTYKNLEGSINQSIKASPTFNRITNTANRKNGFYYGLSAMAKYRIKTGDGYVVWATKSTQISVLDALQISEKGISGFMLLLTAPIGSKSLEMVVDATPDEEVVETPKIGRVANIKIDIVPDAGKISTWKPVTDYANVNNKTIDVMVKITRTPSGGSYTPNYSVTAKKFTGSEFLTFIQGNSSIDIIDSSVAEYEIAKGETKIFRYDVELDITANGNTTKLTGFDTCSFKRVKVLDQIVFYNSNPVAYAEIKEGSPYNESFEAMAGVPTTEKLYFSSGGSEFIVEVKLQYVQDTKTERTYRSEYSGTSCEFKDGDTAKGLGGAPNHGGLASSDTVYQTGPSGSGGCGSPPGWTPPNPGPKTYTYTSASDKVTRSVTVQPVFHDTSSVSVSHGCSGHGSGESFYTCGHCTCSYSYSYSGYWTYTIPMHKVCGPCCQHELPPILDTWKQSITYDHMKIIEAHVWKIDQASVNGMTEITGTDTIKASIIQGDPNIFYNIADLGNPANDGNDSEHGRLRYTVEPQQHDVVVWNEGTRTNKCNGIVSHRSNVNPVANNGHQNSWATGILYTNDAYTNEENYHRNRGTVSTGVSNVADPKDIQTTEWKKFNEHRTTLNTATVISDMLILQTSSGDQSVIYFQKDSTPKQTQQNFDKVVATREEMWDNNTQSAAQWTPYQINIGSYNGNYASMTTKYNGTGKGERVATKFDSDPAKVSTSYKAAYKWITRPARVTNLRLYKDNISQIVTNPNKQYITGNAETFWESILNYESTVGALRSTDYNSKYGKNGYVKKATYSPEHSKVNDIVVHNPVSVEDVAVVGLDESRDQRSTMPIGSAEETLDNINKLNICPRDPGLCEFRVLNCTYYEDRVLASFDFESGAINKITNIMYNLPSGFTIENVNRFGTGKSLSAKGVRWSIALTDLGITYNENTKLYVEADFRIPFSSTASRMVVSFAGYDFYIISGQTIGGWNTGNGAERQANVNIIDKNIKLGIEFDFSNVDNNKLFVNGVEHKVFTRTNESREVTADRVGNYINIGSWTANNNYPADFYLDNLKIVKKGGTSEHTSACYKPVTLHPDGFNYHRHSIECLGVGSTTTGKITTFNYTGNCQQYVAPRTGKYTLEVWGAQGGAGDSRAGKGGYAKGTVNLTAGEVIHIYVGGSSGYNGGATSNRPEGCGGGASDIRIGSGTLYDRILVAGGGGGFGGRSDGIGGSGGGASGGNGGNGYGGIGYGGTQTAGGAGGRNASSGTFGNGGAAGGSNANGRAGGGGGWYGGGGGGNDYPNFNDYDDAGAGGGSGYVFTSTSHKPSGYNVASKYYMTGGTTQAGVRSGNGMAKITEPKNEGIEYAMDLLRDGNITKVKELLGEELYREIVKNNLIYTWAFSGTDTKGFKATNKASVTVNTNKLLFSITGNDPQSEVGVDIDASAISYMKIYFDNNSTGTLGQVFWKKTGTSYAEANSIKYNMTSMTANQVQTIEFDKQSNWNGNITGLRWDFSNAASGNVKISKIEIYGFGSAEADVANNTSTTYEYTGDVQTFTVKYTGAYMLEVWGAQGGSGYNTTGGKGGYAKGETTLNSTTTLNIYVGGQGTKSAGGWNGGGAGGIDSGSSQNAGGGGGATDIRIGGTALANRVIVAGGGGGGGRDGATGAGGGVSGTASEDYNSGYGGKGGTQTAGGTAYYTNRGATNGTLGQGGNGSTNYNAAGGGGGGGGYYGGGGGTSTQNHGSGWSAGGGGGSGYIGGVSGGTTQAGVRSGNGSAKITQLTTVLKITTAMASNNLTVVENKIKENTARIPNNLPDGSPNPIFICHNLINTPGYYNMHLCNRNCHIENVLLCSEPHHNGLHYDGSNDICWDACCVDSNHANYKPKVTTINNESIPNGKFVNMDYDFKIYFPNIGDFNQGQVSGLSTLTTIRGRGYVDNMDTTKWTREKRVRFEFNVIFKGDGKLYRAGEWIELPVTGPTYPYYEFYCVLANYEAKSAAIEYEVEAINCNGNNDNITNNTNRNRFSNYSSYHGAYHTTYIDVVGRIGNLVIDDTEDYRFSNFFKVPVPGDEWLIKGVVKKVYEGMQNQYIAYSEDIRGESIGEDTKWLNTYGTQSWLYKEPILLPLSPEKNNLIPLQSQPMRPGYDVLLDISTIGNYRTKMQIVPYYYAFDLTTGEVIPVDVYMVSEGMYRPINIFDAVKPGWDKGENVLAGSSAIGSFEMPGAELSGTSIVNTLKPDTGETVRAIRLNKDARVPVAQSPYIQLDKDVKYTIEFEYWADEDNVKFDVGLWPDDLPQKLPVANKTVQKMSWEVNSSSANMSNCKLRFFNDTTTYNPANIYITNIKITSGLYPYVMNLDWVAESARRNYDILEKAHTDALAAKYSEEIKGYTDPEYPGELAVTGTRELDRPVGKYYTLGTAQLLVPSGKARTFIGSEYTYGKLMNIGNRIQAEDWWYSAQRWHFKLGLPSSAVIVEHGKNPTIDEINKLSTGNHVILMTADIQSIGDTFVLRYSHKNNNGRIKLGGKTYTMGNDLPPVIAVYSANKTAVQDVDIRGTH